MKTRTPLTWNQVLERKKFGFLVVRQHEQSHKWRRLLKTALRDVDKARNVVGERISVYDCETKERVYHYAFLWSD